LPLNLSNEEYALKAFVDLGAYDGDTLDIAIRKYRGFDRFYAIEPLSENFARLKRRFAGRSDVVLVEAAADVTSGKSRLFLGSDDSNLGGSLCSNKMNCSNQAQEVETIDFADFVARTFQPSDYVVLKIDIEGKEYDLLDRMIETGSIRRVDRLYCEWHHERIGMAPWEHWRFIRRLRQHGLNVSGYNATDEFGAVATMSNWRLALHRAAYYHLYPAASAMKRRLARRFGHPREVVRRAGRATGAKG
jgi:FkbM family methyltransferase